MQATGKRLGIAALAACLVALVAAYAAFSFGGLTAYAQAAWQGSDYGNSLTVTATDNAEMASDLAEAETAIEVDVYRVAAGTLDASSGTYAYTWEAPFGTGAVKSTWFTGDWQAKADDAAKALGEALASGTQVDTVSSTVDGSTAIANLDAGIYLLLAHESGEDVTFDAQHAPTLSAYSQLYEYTFAPALVAVPTQDAAEDGTIVVTPGSDWTADVAVTLKPERTPLYGSLRIDKTVTGVTGTVEPAMFVFDIVGTRPDGAAYAATASIYYTGGDSASTTVEHIPAGTKVKVTESYEGARYALVTSDEETKTIVADRYVEDGTQTVATAAFTNKVTGGNGGSGIQNYFKYEVDGDWHWYSTPVQTVTAS